MMEYFINIANILYLLSYFVRDIFWLRVLTVIAASFLTLYFYFQPDPLMTAVCWNLFFIALNVYWVIRLVLEHPAYLERVSTVIKTGAGLGRRTPTPLLTRGHR